jgi:hypothetical protein
VSSRIANQFRARFGGNAFEKGRTFKQSGHVKRAAHLPDEERVILELRSEAIG